MKKPIKMGIPFLGIPTIFFLFFAAYTYSKQTYYESQHIVFDTGGIPIIEVRIEDKSFPLIIDFGCFGELTLYSDHIDSLKKTSCGSERWMNFSGTKFEYPKYSLPNMQIGSLNYRNVESVSMPKERAQDYVIWKDQTHTREEIRVGSIGRALLKKRNLLLDTKNSKAIFSNDKKRLASDGYPLSSYLKLPLKISPIGILLKITTDLGTHSFVLDTGCTYVVYHDLFYPESREKVIAYNNIPKLESNAFSIGGVDFGPQTLYFLEIDEEMRDFDGLLGMDFIENHVLYFDFSAKTLYIEMP